MPNSLAIIGAGRVGRTLGRRLRELGWKIGAVVTRSEPSARRAVRFIGAGKACTGMTRQILASRVILIATPDDEIAVVAREPARIGEEELRGRVVLHASGAMDSAVLDAVHERGAMVGSRHPLQSFSGVSGPSLEGRVFTIEGETQAVRVARQIARSLGGSPVRIAGSKKILYHAAAAMADKYLEQARYDERRGHMAEAAQAYEKVIRGRPTAHVYERAAHCWLEANGNPKKAFDLAKKAVAST